MKLPLVIAIGIVAAVPAASDAAVHQATFKVSVSGSQVTEWRERTHPTGGDCKGRTFERGAGHETVTFASKGTTRYKSLSFGGRATLYPTGRYARFGMHSPGKTERDGVYVYSKDSNGPCATPETSYIPDADCDTLSRHFNVQLVYDGKRLGLVVGPGIAPIDRPFSSCPIQNSDEVMADGITDITAPLPAKELFDRSIGKEIVLGEKTFDPFHVNAWSTAKTTVKWKATFTRVHK